MKFNNRVKVTGMKAVDVEMEGQRYDSTKVFLEIPLDDSKGTAKGFATAEYSFGKHDEFDKYKHLPFPFEAEAEMEMVTSGKVSKVVLHAIKPVAQVK
ncbi:hypothetical protein GPA22_17690 [Aromatoleum toluvorans]|uniref:Single-stranded DNA-binding protein n=1 Tax=Aromatoleum toluvorans TaxID=92002 RepID=A0ABX1Q291_9RHOO|nr:hypothetical protein [Aromatoleum toluvorans]NMG45550.1 hypothetical protein [Aromatoleum toluvorans]